MLGDLNVPTSGSAGLVSNTIGPYFGTQTRVFHYSTGIVDQQVIADETGRIVAGDIGQITVDQFLSANPNVLIIPDVKTTSIYSTLSPNYAAYVGLALVAFLALRGLR